MMRYLLAGLCGLGVAGVGYKAMHGGDCPMCHMSAARSEPLKQVILADVAASEPATAPATDVKNTKCMVMNDDDADGPTTIYKGKTYHFCCNKCVKTFNADPEKYIKQLEADPAKYGVK